MRTGLWTSVLALAMALAAGPVASKAQDASKIPSRPARKDLKRHLKEERREAKARQME